MTAKKHPAGHKQTAEEKIQFLKDLFETTPEEDIMLDEAILEIKEMAREEEAAKWRVSLTQSEQLRKNEIAAWETREKQIRQDEREKMDWSRNEASFDDGFGEGKEAGRQEAAQKVLDIFYDCTHLKGNNLQIFDTTGFIERIKAEFLGAKK